MYYRVARANGRVYADCWWFLRCNHFDHAGVAEICRSKGVPLIVAIPCPDHEGDWEG